MAIRAVSFDADQTLWDFRGVYRKALDAAVRAMIDNAYVDVGAVTAEDLVAVRDEIAQQYRGRPHTLEEVRERSFAVFLRRAGVEDADSAAAAIADLYLEVRFTQIELYAEVQASLNRIKERHLVGLITNGNTYPERCGLPNIFDAQVLGPEHGIEKPDPKAFRLLTDQLRIQPHELVHVGDGRDDIDGANATGATSVWIGRDGTVPPWATDADHKITSLIELESILEAGVV